VLFPTDNLILGWNLPSSKRAFIRRTGDQYTLGQASSSSNQLGPQLSLGPEGVHKLIIYGSPISKASEGHDTLNQLLTSEAVHEVIG
jgi:hypothetical protein